MSFKILFEPNWDKYFKKFDKTNQQYIWKKIKQMKEGANFRHLKFGLDYFVAEIGQYRIIFKEQENSRDIYFVGNHKQYEEWYKEQ